jgi:hypothetical protein
MEDSFLREATHVLSVTPARALNFTFGYCFREPGEFGPTDLGNNLFLSSITYRLNENWAVRATHQFNANDSVMEEQTYTLYRDLRSWTAALIVRIRENWGREDDVTVALTFSLKAFARFGLDQEGDKASRLLGN